VEARGRSVRAVVVHADLEVAAQGPVFGLLAAVEPRIGAGPHDEVATGGPIPVTGAIARRVAGARGPRPGGPARAIRTAGLEIQTPDVSADLEADIGARDVVEAVAVKAADLHVLHRRCLDWHVGGLRPSDRNEPRGPVQ